MPQIAIAGTPRGAENFILALESLGATGVPVLEETDLTQYDGLILPGGADIDPALFGEENWGRLMPGGTPPGLIFPGKLI